MMHPGPMNRGVEIDSSVADGDQSVILKQVTNGISFVWPYWRYRCKANSKSKV